MTACDVRKTNTNPINNFIIPETTVSVPSLLDVILSFVANLPTYVRLAFAVVVVLGGLGSYGYHQVRDVRTPELKAETPMISAITTPAPIMMFRVDDGQETIVQLSGSYHGQGVVVVTMSPPTFRVPVGKELAVREVISNHVARTLKTSSSLQGDGATLVTITDKLTVRAEYWIETKDVGSQQVAVDAFRLEAPRALVATQ